MKHMSIKIISFQLFSLLIIFFLYRILLNIFESYARIEEFAELEFLVGMFATALAIFILFAFFINQLIVKRIKKITNATKTISEGDFSANLKIQGKDELATLAENFNLMSQQLRKNAYVNKNFVRNISHEMKTPLSAIQGYAHLLRTNQLSKDKQYNAIETIEREAKRLSGMTTNMLALSKIENTDIINKSDFIDLAEQIRNVLQSTQLEWESKNISFNLELEDISIRGNANLIYNAWQNLVDNAIKFSKDNGVITITLTEDEGKVLLSVKDEGDGIPESFQKDIFELFTVAEPSRSQGGSGIGLTLTKTIIEKMGGTISFVSEISQGTTFYVTLPKIPTPQHTIYNTS